MIRKQLWDIQEGFILTYLPFWINQVKLNTRNFSPASLDEVLSSRECHWLCSFFWNKTKCFCRFLDRMLKSQARISKKDTHKAEGKMPFPKQFQNRNWQAEVRMMCNREHCLHGLMIIWSRNGVQQITLLAQAKFILLVDIYVQLYFEKIFPFQNPAYKVCSMERRSSKPGKCINQMECLLWNPIRSSLWYFIS